MAHAPRGVRNMKNGENIVAEVDGLYRSVRNAHDYVEFLKVGKLNHNQAVEQSALGPKFRAAAIALLERYGCKHYIREDLRKAS